MMQTMRTFYAATVLKEKGKLSLDHLPFAKGDAVQIFVSASATTTGVPFPLRGTVVQYDQPTGPVGAEDWKAAP